MKDSRKVIACGTPYQQGIAQGEAFRALIQHNIQAVRTDLENSHLDIDRYQQLTVRNAAFLQKDQPQQWEEMQGIAAGAQVSFDDILLINVPTYFLKSACGQECSMLLVRGAATADGLTYLAKNRDMGMQMEQVTVEYRYPDKTSICEVGGAGIVTYPALGVNSAGLTVTSTGFWSPKVEMHLDDVDNRHIFVNLHHVLQSCHTTHDVLDFLDHYPRMNGLNLIAADENSAVLVETTRDEYLVQWADESGILYRTNHYMLGEHQKLNKEFEEYPSTFLRYERIGTMVSQAKRKFRFQDILRILSDHENSPINGICRHANELAPARTVSCSICCLEDRELFNTPGNPCEHMVAVAL